VDNNLLETREKGILDLPLKLPMIVKPKNFNSDSLGGYLLNDVRYQEDLIIHKYSIKDKSQIKENNIIYDMIIKISAVPYKINIKLLDFLITDKHKLLIDSNLVADQENNLENMSKYQLNKFKSLKSKFNLQETILGIAEFYKSYNNIYFPKKK
jgi:DNA-directed RNA polymerase